jgi:hypothetical protein
MGGQHLTIPCTLSNNGYSIKLNALADSGANGFVFIDTQCAIDIAKFLDIKAQQLLHEVTVKGYNSKAGNAISHYL